MIAKEVKHVTIEKDVAGYKEASERLVVLLAATRHEIELLEWRSKQLERPFPAAINLAKAVDKAILRAFGVSDLSLAHIIPPEVRSLEGVDLDGLSDDELAASIADYDKRFAIAERTAHLHGLKQTAGRGYRVFRGLMVRTVKFVGRLYKGVRR